MALDLNLAIAHHLLIFILFGILVSELVLVREVMNATGVKRIAAIDLWYGIVALLILIVGFSRVFFAAKARLAQTGSLAPKNTNREALPRRELTFNIVEAGDDLTPYLSDQIDRLGYVSSEDKHSKPRGVDGEMMTLTRAAFV